MSSCKDAEHNYKVIYITGGDYYFYCKKCLDMRVKNIDKARREY